ncbi:hypothetical protein SanaruYs_05630 [Chryseotalea sanaruensis]|uniref:Uncharacterized protein n=1 Tax=Chryseotalea sanaruensis TaxID=2482724 RepID=A0A401U5Z2_9BACT|nr:hypothetical protein [Chryseotalea sanaruensis]GCC50348.1 hypothetical protein SanaruYs_05630 [Chryseotalea sanaruensis]
MIGKEIVIKLLDDKAYLTEDKFLTFQQIGLPNFVKQFKTPTAWTIKVLKQFPIEQKIFAEILSYTNEKLPFSHYQVSGSSDIKNIEKITFKNIDTEALVLTLAGKATSHTIVPTIERVAKVLDYEQSPYQTPVQLKRESQIKKVSETFFIPLKNVRFKLGGVSFDKLVASINRTIEFTVVNGDIREEFDAVKNYFGNVLQTKKIQFIIEIQLIDGEITKIKAESPEISRIDKKLIESVKFEIVESLHKPKIDVEMEKSIFMMDEFFDTITNQQVKASVFYDNENQLLDDLLQITASKHYKHLRFLSSKHAHSVMKLRFVIKPFSFIFLIEGERNYHIIWETLDTEEATYVWHEVKNLNKLELTLKKIDHTLNVIKAQGKKTYINSTQDNFRRIYHDYSELVDGFLKWKVELESGLT